MGVPLNNVSGGLFTHPDILSDTWTLGGVVTDEWIWGLELGENQTWNWISIALTSGTLEPGESEEMEVYFDATDFIPWSYEAEIQFSTIPDVGSPVVEVSMDIEGPPMPPYNLEAAINCVIVDLTWELSPLYYPPVTFNVYRNDEFVANVSDLFYSDTSGYPEIPYEYTVTSVYTIGETFPSQPANTIIPLPDSLEPLNLYYSSLPYNLILLTWFSPSACIEPIGYNVYCDNTIIGFIEDTSFLCSYGFYEFWVTAVYYFGESNPSNSIIITGLPETDLLEIIIYPNPAKDKLYIQSPEILSKIELFNNIGMVISNKKVNSKTFELDVSHFSPGHLLFPDRN